MRAVSARIRLLGVELTVVVLRADVDITSSLALLTIVALRTVITGEIIFSHCVERTIVASLTRRALSLLLFSVSAWLTSQWSISSLRAVVACWADTGYRASDDMGCGGNWDALCALGAEE